MEKKLDALDVLDALDDKLTLVQKFETLFNKETVDAFKEYYGRKNGTDTNTFLYEMDAEKAGIAFDNFKFKENDARMTNINLAIQILKKTFPPGTKELAALDDTDDTNGNTKVLHFFNLAIATITNPRTSPASNDSFFEFIGLPWLGSWFSSDTPTQNQPPMDEGLIFYIRELIKEQKKSIEDEITSIVSDMVAKAETELKQANTSASRAKTLRYTTAFSLFTAGAGLVTLSSLLQFSPHIILQIGLHLPPVALAMLTSLHLTPVILAVLAATGVGMAGAAAYFAYRTYYRTASVVRPVNAEPVVGNTPAVATTSLSAKLLTGGLMASGFGLLGFSAATVFSPAFVLFTGLQLPPAALIAFAAVGALLISVAVYRLIKTNAMLQRLLMKKGIRFRCVNSSPHADNGEQPSIAQSTANKQ